MQELFRRYGLEQVDLTRALAKWTPPISRSYAHYIWHGVKPPSINVILAIQNAYAQIPADELLLALRTTREPIQDQAALAAVVGPGELC